MPATATHKHPKGYTVVFDEASHTYTTDLKQFMKPDKAIPRCGNEPFPSFGQTETDVMDPGVVSYVSGTKFVHHFFPKFDPDGKIAEAKARQRGVSPDQIRFEWKQKANAATEMGTRVHETCEDVLHGRAQFRNAPQTEHERNLMSAGWRACQWILKNYEILGIEQMVADMDCQLAGTMDLIARRRNDGRMTIFDWKTNAKIDFHNTFPTGNRGLHPIEHLENCSAVHYGLQLSTYEFVMKISGYVPRDTPFDRVIVHLADDGPHPYPLPDYAIEVREMAICMLEEPPF